MSAAAPGSSFSAPDRPGSVPAPLVPSGPPASATSDGDGNGDGEIRKWYERIVLPRPTGPYAVGTSSLHLTDRDRQEPWVPGAGPRQSLVSLHYPARPRTGGPVAPYVRADEARALVETLGKDLLPPDSAGPIAGTRTWSRQDARPARGSFPLLVLSPGFGAPRQSLTHLAESLAGNGYVVASLDHAFESAATAFPDRGVLPCTACEKTETGEVGHAAVVEGRAKDVSHVLDRLLGPASVWRHSSMIDPRRIGMAGHSIGGASAARTMAEDPRVDAGVNMDGSFFSPVPEEGLRGRPFLLLGAEDGVPGGTDATWDDGWKRLDGWKRWLTVAGSHHLTFSDAPVLASALGVPGTPGGLSGRRSQQITRDCVTAFFDRHLKHADRPLLDGPTAANPEITFHSP
ncbi:lipase [Streptomyces clavuligerus]|nr:lipase [Streptomyces clavuligerus]